MSGESYAITMRAKLKNAFRFGFTGTPIDKTMHNTHRDFGPIQDSVQERYLSYYGIRRAITDGATLEVHYVRDKVPFQVNEERSASATKRYVRKWRLRMKRPRTSCSVRSPNGRNWRGCRRG